MSGYVPRKVSNARMRTKTNQTGLKMQGSASILGRRNYIQRYVNRHVQTGFGVDGYPNGWRCISGVDPVTASDEAKEAKREAEEKANIDWKATIDSLKSITEQL